jgi:hypothetical protein
MWLNKTLTISPGSVQIYGSRVCDPQQCPNYKAHPLCRQRIALAEWLRVTPALPKIVEIRLAIAPVYTKL